ncbi:hypothetical protein [Methylocella sp. CPCC 101449]|uniref:hypothetical protein n=1 Tax=Methylocella sp. CPCC 101449 TaxID=2987531 RepID=UPI0028916137|nr:hypothetical protein [Methylocella sp. CPCC 101449]MDT2024531.1 hypothetical protein [Methylocella sp. CPCC 101449]
MIAPEPTLSKLMQNYSSAVQVTNAANDGLPDAEFNKLTHAECEAFRDLIKASPATLGGLIALIEFALAADNELQEGQDANGRPHSMVLIDTILRSLRRLQHMRSGGMNTGEIQAAFDAYAELCEAEHEINDRYREAQENGADPGRLKKLWAEVMKAEKKGQAAHAALFKIKPATLEALHLKTVLILNIDELAADTIAADIAWLAGIDGGGHEKAT